MTPPQLGSLSSPTLSDGDVAQFGFCCSLYDMAYNVPGSWCSPGVSIGVLHVSSFLVNAGYYRGTLVDQGCLFGSPLAGPNAGMTPAQFVFQSSKNGSNGLLD